MKCSFFKKISIKKITIFTFVLLLITLLYSAIVKPGAKKLATKVASEKSRGKKLEQSLYAIQPRDQLFKVLRIVNSNSDFRKNYFVRDEERSKTGMTKKEFQANLQFLENVMPLKNTLPKNMKHKIPKIEENSLLFSSSDEAVSKEQRSLFRKSIRFFPSSSPSSSSSSSPKIACLISGFLRRFEILLDSCPPEIHDCSKKGGYLRKRILDPLGCDIFISTWNIRGFGGRAFHDYDAAEDSSAILSGNYIASVFYGGQQQQQRQQQQERKREKDSSSKLVGLHLQPYQDHFEKLFLKMEGMPKKQGIVENGMNTNNNTIIRNDSETPFFFRQAKPSQMNTKAFESSVGLAGNTVWDLADQTNQDTQNDKNSIRRKNNNIVLDDHSKQFLRRSDFSQVYKQYCAWEMATLFEEEQQDKNRNRNRNNNYSYSYDFFYRMRMDLRPTRMLQVINFNSEERKLVFSLMMVPERADGKKEQENSPNNNQHQYHSISPHRIHVHSNDISDFIMFAERSVAKRMLTKIWKEQLVKSCAQSYYKNNNTNKRDVSDDRSSLIFPEYVSDQKDKTLLNEREIHFHQDLREDIRKEYNNNNHDHRGDDVVFINNLHKMRRYHLKAGTFAEFNLMFWREIFDGNDDNKKMKKRDKNTSSFLEVDYVDGGYMKMDAKKLFFVR